MEVITHSMIATSAKDTLEIAVEFSQKVSQEIKPLSLLFGKVFVSSL